MTRQPTRHVGRPRPYLAGNPHWQKSAISVLRVLTDFLSGPFPLLNFNCNISSSFFRVSCGGGMWLAKATSVVEVGPPPVFVVAAMYFVIPISSFLL